MQKECELNILLGSLLSNWLDKIGVAFETSFCIKIVITIFFCYINNG